jgi:CSLREA domain-containing protein
MGRGEEHGERREGDADSVSRGRGRRGKREIAARGLLCLVAAGLLSLGFATAARADFVVDDLDDVAVAPQNGTCDAPGDHTCTLREAISEANITLAPDTITFSVNGTIDVSDVGTLTINRPTTIDGNGPGNTIVDGADAVRLFTVNLFEGGLTTFRDLRLEDGSASDPLNGGAAIRSLFAVTLDNVVVTSSRIIGEGGGAGAGVRVSAPGQALTVTDSIISNNTISSNGANGGAGIAAAGPVNLTDSTVSGNQITAGNTASKGAGIFAEGGFEISQSAVIGNALTFATTQGGGGLFASTGLQTQTITNSTFSGNGAAEGGGLYASSPVAITHTTFAENQASTAGADVFAFGSASSATADSSIFASAPGACGTGAGGTINSGTGSNIDVGTSCGFGTADGNRQDTDPLLAPLALNAPGTTETHALLPGSPAIDTANMECADLASDQRGVARPQPVGGRCDIGAFELQQAPPSGGGSSSTTPAPLTANPRCAQLRKKLKKTKLKAKRRKLRRKLRRLGC